MAVAGSVIVELEQFIDLADRIVQSIDF